MTTSERSEIEPSKSWRDLIHTAKDLETLPESTRQGFIDQAFEKGRRAIAIEKRMHDFRIALEAVKQVEDLFTLKEYEVELIAAASYSGKGWEHVKRGEPLDEQRARLRRAFTDIYLRCQNEAESEESCLSTFRERILFRSLLTQGETLGGSIKTWIGRIGTVRLVEALQEFLGRRETVQHAKGSPKVQRIRWNNRLLLFDTKPTLIIKGGKVEVALSSSSQEKAETPVEIPLNNIDVILLDTTDLQKMTTPTIWDSIDTARSSDSVLTLSTEDLLQAEKGLLKEPKYYLACGELKSGVDPAGGDEHWKTAIGAFDRIRDLSTTISEFHPKLFFVGRAIERVMANDIFLRLENGVFSFAANLTNREQTVALAEWLTTL